MKKTAMSVVFVLFAAVFFCSCKTQNTLEVFLVSGDLPENDIIVLNELTLEESPVLTLNDIRQFYWDKQEFTLKDGSLSELLNRDIPVSGLPYVLAVNGKRIYMGKFWTPLSSAWPYSPSISIAFENPDVTRYSVYYDGDESEVKQIIFDERIRKVLESAGLLQAK